MAISIPTVSECCCCLRLRTAGIILGVLGILACGSELFETDYLWKKIYFVVIIIFEILWLIGIARNSPKLMLPSLIVSVLELIVLLLSPLFLPYFLIYFIPSLYKLLEKNEDIYVAMYIFICVVLYISLALSVYFFIVCYSLYKQISDKVSGVRAVNEDHSIKYGP